MPSTFTWLDYSEHERRKMLDAIELFGEKTTRDELGIGAIRDAFSDLLFPGTNTIQTVAKYFLFVPWMYLDLERKLVSSDRVADRARSIEIRLAKTLADSNTDAHGVIGRRAQDSLKRLPSSVYWQGLLTWGIRVYPNSQSNYHQSLDSHYARIRGRDGMTREFEGEGAYGSPLTNWDPSLVASPSDFPNVADLELSLDEASYLRDRILTSCPDSLLAYLLRERAAVDSALFAWDINETIPETLQRILTHAQNFSEILLGAQLLYNLILAELSNNPDRCREYRQRLSEWSDMMEESGERIRQWDLDDFWNVARSKNDNVLISFKAQQFVMSWVKLVLESPSFDAIIKNSNAKDLVCEREIAIKGVLARTSNQRARDLWTGAAGSEQMDLRWRTSRRILGDILRGFRGTTHATAI